MSQSSSKFQDDNRPKFLVIGGGARGQAYARAVTESTNGIIAAIAEPLAFKRNSFGRKYVWGSDRPSPGQEFPSWEDFYDYECRRRTLERAGENVPSGVDGIFVCTLDHLHAEVIIRLAPLGLHCMSEKPLATTLNDCLKIFHTLQAAMPPSIFSIGHVLRYSPHNMLLRKLLLDQKAIGDVLSIEHTEPVGWWHFSHSYVRGNWRKESTAAPSLLTKSCHDIDLILWLLCSPPTSASNEQPHHPARVSSVGSLTYHKKSRKPSLAGDATNCLRCSAESECIYSAKKIYNSRHLAKGNAGWPVDIIDPEIEDMLTTAGKSDAENRLMQRLAEDYNKDTAQAVVDCRPWYGRCIYESDNDVCDDQFVTISWDDDTRAPDINVEDPQDHSKGAKTASFHMVAFTEKQCERRGRVYGTKGEIEYDSKLIKVFNFATEETRTHHPHQPGGGHGGGDDGLALQYVMAVEAVKNGGMSVDEAQRVHIGCTLEEAFRSHAMIFAAEEARKERKVVEWAEWWASNVHAPNS